jgi:DHA1 family bicyclomycin/chloramphenicol resistance-like MFS transporter
MRIDAPSKYPTWPPSLLGLFIAVGPAATDMYLPAFPAVEASFGTAPGTAQITLATWFAGLAVGQLTQGTLSDRFGRRIPLLVGFVVFMISTLGCALAPSLAVLAILRFVAAFGASAGMVIARAVVRDLAEGQAAAIMMSRLILVMGVAPVLAPTIGGAILAFAHWRVIFWLLTIYSFACIILAWKALPETLPEDQRTRLSLAGQASRYMMILREKTFLTHATMGGCSSFCMFAYLSGCSPVFEDGFGLNPSQFALIFGLCAVSLVGCSQLNARLLPRFGLHRMLTAVAWVSFTGTIVLVVLAFSGVHVLWAIVAPLVLVIGCQGFNNANATAGALTRHAGHAGSASALMGTFQFGLGASSGVLVGFLTDGTPRGMAAMMACGMLGAVIADRFRPRTEAPRSKSKN